MALVRRAKVSEGPAAALPADGSKGAWAKYPVLLEWLTSVTWPGEGTRVTGTIMVFAEEGRWKAWLHDRDALEGCFCTADTLDALMAVVEGCLASGKGDWRGDRRGGRKGS